jgi:hypothetical protein
MLLFHHELVTEQSPNSTTSVHEYLRHVSDTMPLPSQGLELSKSRKASSGGVALTNETSDGSGWISMDPGGISSGYWMSRRGYLVVVVVVVV